MPACIALHKKILALNGAIFTLFFLNFLTICLYNHGEALKKYLRMYKTGLLCSHAHSAKPLSHMRRSCETENFFRFFFVIFVQIFFRNKIFNIFVDFIRGVAKGRFQGVFAPPYEKIQLNFVILLLRNKYQKSNLGIILKMNVLKILTINKSVWYLKNM